jgi:hypothetical protein
MNTTAVKTLPALMPVFVKFHRTKTALKTFSIPNQEEKKHDTDMESSLLSISSSTALDVDESFMQIIGSVDFLRSVIIQHNKD